MENPFCYIPFTAKRLKETDKNTKEYRKLLKAACKNSLFFTKLTECVVADNDNNNTRTARRQLINDTRMLVLFLRIGLIGAAAGAIGAFLLRDSLLGENAKYIFAAAAVALPFAFGYFAHSKRMTFVLGEKYLEEYKLPDERFTEKRIVELVLIKSSANDVIHTSELSQDIPCGCYNCQSRFGSSQLRMVELSEEYACPYCGKTTVISKRCGFEITDELLHDLHDYWKDY